jgi:hypothetical protein
LGGIKDDIAHANGVNTTVTDPLHGGFYLHTLDVRIHDIDLAGANWNSLATSSILRVATTHSADDQA